MGLKHPGSDNQFLSPGVLKLTYVHLQFQKFPPGLYPRGGRGGKGRVGTWKGGQGKGGRDRRAAWVGKTGGIASMT